MAEISKIKLPNNSIYNLRDDVHIWGGRNYMVGSQNLTNTTLWVRSAITSLVGNQTDPSGKTEAFLVTPSSSSWFLTSKKNLLTEVGETYTFSIWLRANNATTCNLCIRYLDSEYPYSGNATKRTVNVTTNWQRFVVVGSLNKSQTESNTDLFWIGQKTTEPLFVYHPKAEKGNKPTDWSPAPEDIAYVDGTQLVLLS